MHTRITSIVLLGLGIVDLGVLDLLLAPRLARMDAEAAALVVRDEAAVVTARLDAEPARAPGDEARAAWVTPGAVTVRRVHAAPDVTFSSDSILVKGRATFRALERVIEELDRDPEKGLLLRGHSDPAGLPAYNVALALRRADAVKQHLVRHGAPADRIAIESVGAEEPLDPRPTRTAWARDRRVELLWR